MASSVAPDASPAPLGGLSPAAPAAARVLPLSVLVRPRSVPGTPLCGWPLVSL